MRDDLDLTVLLRRWQEGDESAFVEVLSALYDRLRYLARGRLAGERADHTLDSGDLVTEAYLKLADVNRMQWHDREHFLAVASRTMRRILIDHARRHRTVRRGGDRRRVPLSESHLTDHAAPDRPIAIEEARDRPDEAHPRERLESPPTYLNVVLDWTSNPRHRYSGR